LQNQTVGGHVEGRLRPGSDPHVLYKGQLGESLQVGQLSNIHQCIYFKLHVWQLLY